MATMLPPASGAPAHEVVHQPPPLAPLKLLSSNRPLAEAVEREGGRPGAHAARTALYLAASAAEAGHGCPITMTFAAVPALRARRVVERMALCRRGALLARHAPGAVTKAFCAGRLDPGAAGAALGTLPRSLDLGAVIARAMPVTA